VEADGTPCCVLPCEAFLECALPSWNHTPTHAALSAFVTKNMCQMYALLHLPTVIIGVGHDHASPEGSGLCMWSWTNSQAHCDKALCEFHWSLDLAFSAPCHPPDRRAGEYNNSCMLRDVVGSRAMPIVAQTSVVRPRFVSEKRLLRSCKIVHGQSSAVVSAAHQ
jgi:hypothetical protein